MSHPIWQIGLFDKRDKDIVECLELMDLKLSAGSIKGIKTHLFGKHKDSKYTEQYIRIEEGKSKQANTKITNYYTHSSGKLSVMDKNVINYIACCNIPFRIINHPTFKKLVRNMSDKLLGESHYRKNVLPEIYKIVKSKIKLEVKELEHICFTTDLWTADTTKDAFISLTATGVTATFTRKNYTLAIQKFSGTHTAEKIAEILTELLDQWGLKSHCFLTDSGANIVKVIHANLNYSYNSLGT
uniref:DUF659 domain-containing protein n=1 Tax=Meloidogyne hapla TaxID=6305 RepID=A0A1I8B461_MELHA